MISLINLILLFNDNVAFYSLKKKIFLLIIDCNNKIKNFNEIILSEYYFTCLLNKKRRKSAISWDYKYFLFLHFKNDLFTIEKNNNKYILHLLKNELNIIGIKEEIFNNYLFILKDLEIINEINIIQNRNFHLWTYLRKIYNEMDKNEKILILLFAFLTLRKCNFDYSAFTFIVNSKNNMPFTKEQLELLIKDIKKASIFKYDEHKCYIDDLDKFLFN